MKIGIIGLGNIAQKAYLPVYSQLRDQATFILSTRNEETRKEISEKYDFNEMVASTEELIEAKVSACFVHAATKVHGQLVKQLLEAGIHVFVDKPLSENLAEVKEIQTLAAEKNLLLMVGFNRRFAPLVEELKAVENKNMLLIQKNRIASESTANFVIYDLFLHVADILVYLLDDEIRHVQTKIIEENNLLKRAILHVETATTTAIASMNLYAGANTETYQLTSPEGTLILENLTDLTIKNQLGTQQKNFGDWATTLEKRGFQQMVEEFIKAVQTNEGSRLKQEKVFTSHELCAQMIRKHQEHIL
ncbi:gfo/Idh/MocA family oxidoreductase [Enterococcus haemoperoxidus ATCC BAA-382]|uniref:Gfo/Idh/MocA family oxidoreductase n=1 Tax=Enterococcus haemoperoxidus ATCC BAA-382 TaxID=1158608 RepID=R2QX97_9ENTE|nr:Gfo/Idh/MocA family oxidoreductase [Enterococcus haemoperoxidus]EOH99948.1 gfo/Idh/MocA family oxidoreductase [Enterococcus haemoperoxidus ATCC BAA-382]EOT63061.1 gfo/Idh/MocA family oxidoreductase [Enterococcus haemoperoxidus ATCC BAA-382]OJG54581.1 gfo/Idh/MocA family oxidoreductase [Enterococcus haemoperoxidus]